MLSVAFALQTLSGGCDRPYFRTCDNPVTAKLSKNIIQSLIGSSDRAVTVAVTML
jgi:hypothetical protein